MVWVCSVVSDSLQPHGLQPPSSSVHGISQARRACHFFLQGVFLTQGLNPCLQGLLLSRRLLYCWTTGEVPKFHTLLCKCSHCFATEDTSIFNNKTPWESHSWQCQSKSQNYTNEGLMQENYELFALLAVLGKSAHGQTRGGLVPGCGRETRDNRYWCLAMFCPSVSAHISAQLGVLSINSESQVVSAKSCFVHIAVCMWQLGAFTCTRCCLGPRWALPLSIFMGLTSVTRLPPRCPLWILAKVCPNCLYLRTAGLSPPTRVPLGLWAVEGVSYPVRGHGLVVPCSCSSGLRSLCPLRSGTPLSPAALLTLFRCCVGPRVSTSFVPVVGPAPRIFLCISLQWQRWEKPARSTFPSHMGRTAGTTDLQKTLGESRWEGGSLNRAAYEAGPPLPPQGPWGSKQDSPGALRASATSACQQSCSVFPSAHLPSSASFPCTRYVSMHFFPMIRLGPQKYLEVCPDPEPMKVFQSLPENAKLCLPAARWVLGAVQLHRWAFLSLSFSWLSYPAPHIYFKTEV